MTLKLLPLFVLSACSVFAQPAEYLRSPDVNWAAIIEIVLPADPLLASANEPKEASMAVLKLTSDDQSLYGYVGHSLNAKLWDLASTGEWEAFADANLTQPLSADEVLKKVGGPDTTLTYDPETYNEKIEITWDLRPVPDQITNLKVRQLLTYDDTKGSFSILTLAIAPYDNGKTPYWLKVPASDTPDAELLETPDINWAVRYVTRNSSPQIRDFQVVKEEVGPVMEVFFEKMQSSPNIPLYNAVNHYDPLPSNLRACLFHCTDTTTTVDPENYEEQTQIVRSGLKAEDITDLELIQEW
ncbi:MAG: hypothetical protein IT270_15660, partial [Saprospiraceae bacterium]|nr:hypothetical protein [Saprospiraceae bacterium]